MWVTGTSIASASELADIPMYSSSSCQYFAWMYWTHAVFESHTKYLCSIDIRRTHALQNLSQRRPNHGRGLVIAAYSTSAITDLYDGLFAPSCSGGLSDERPLPRMTNSCLRSGRIPKLG